MALLDPSTILCKYFAAGKCRRSDCYYSHDPEKSKAGNLCRFFPLGICFYGDECKFDHPKGLLETPDLSELQISSAVIVSTPSVPVPPRGPRTRSETAAAAKAGKVVASVVELPPRKSQKRHAKRPHVDTEDETVATSSSTPTEVNVPKTVRRPPLCPIGRSRTSCGLIDCPFRHGDFCDMCHCLALDPEDAAQRADHIAACEKILEKDLHTTFAILHSQDLQCNVCLDIVKKQADKTKRRFGVLEGCQHVFCFSCIMLWRKQATDGEEAVKRNRTCPTCRTHSHYVFPTDIWPDSKDDKTAFIKEFKESLSKKHCVRFDHGKGKCQFGNKCWYLHSKEDGTVVQLPAPRSKPRVPRTITFDAFDVWEDVFGVDSGDDISNDDHDSDLGMDQGDDIYMDMVDYADQIANNDLLEIFGVGTAALPPANADED